MRVRSRVPLAPRTTLGVGGPALHYLSASSVAELREGLTWAAGRRLPTLVLGGGSNLVVSDDGFPGLVLEVELRGLDARSVDGGGVRVEVAAGEPWDRVVGFAVASGLQGVECLAGIPGRTGATPIQNVGAYGQEVADRLVAVETIERSTGEAKIFDRDACHFGYRSSRFKGPDRERYVVTGVVFDLAPGAPADLRYAELVRELTARSVAPDDLAGVRRTVLAIRRRKGMVVDPADPETRSAGSFFLNPVIPAHRVEATLERIATTTDVAPGSIPRFPGPSGTKLAAAWLVERSGVARGTRLGSAAVSTRHALAIVSAPGGTASDVIALARLVRARVEDRFGLRLEPEPTFVGFPDPDPLGPP